MKLRMQFNSIRLRLKRGEVERLARTDRVEGKIVFGEGAENTFTYILEASPNVTVPQTCLAGNGIIVQVPRDMVKAWAFSDEVGMEGSQAVSAQGRLQVLIEKDFACLEGTDEENADTFPHPESEAKR